MRRFSVPLFYPLPDPVTQKRIAAILIQADRLRRIRSYALELSDAWLPAAFSEIFGSPAEALERWPTARLDDCCRRITDGTHLTPEFRSVVCRMQGAQRL
jgi:type I restriction enzyme S subunit